jgi:3'-5' exoribonuclease
LVAEIHELIAGFGNPHLRALLEALFGDDEWLARFRVHPAGSRLHHGFVGGLLEHSTMIARSAVNLCGGNPRLDRDLLVTGALVHDIGKMDEIGPSPERNYTDPGRLIGHLVMGAMTVERIIDTLPDFPAPLRLHVLHLILSHHGTREFGSPVLPATPEAVALFHLDNIDAKVEAAARLIAEDTDANSNFTGPQHMFGNIGLFKTRPESSKEDGEGQAESNEGAAEAEEPGLFD